MKTTPALEQLVGEITDVKRLRSQSVGGVLLPHEAAEYLRVSLRTLDRLRIRRSKIGHRSVRYLQSDLDAFLSAHREVA